MNATGVAPDDRFGESEEPGMDRNDLRIGDAEREQTMAALREHFAQGRLTHEELDERLDRTLTAKTGRDLAQVTSDLPGHAYREPAPQYDMDGWRQSMAAHHRQMQSMRHAQRDMRRQWAHHPSRRHHRGPHPFVGVLFVFMMLSLIFGGFGVFKIFFMVWLVAMVFGLVHRRFHRRA
ncbi:DUF1707 SHOCT-like domain-containing protein [Nonomuraea basaltis]|uniref:DUF1707 SHOCT-like domain-containing protein n=1 Tax=Nonomuraea basaltis TaxID=2495887 RepID=UPI00110C45DE|nr:DUF1707 domain-containing protein [Nonomuraea basaltis]TMR99298.1 DUF1707 domain-containing protein [Nonomuraea basaltis]